MHYNVNHTKSMPHTREFIRRTLATVALRRVNVMDTRCIVATRVEVAHIFTLHSTVSLVTLALIPLPGVNTLGVGWTRTRCTRI